MMATESEGPGTGMNQNGRSLAKDFHRLMKNIASMSGGQARLVGWDEADLGNDIRVSVIPDSGLYKGGEFIFSIQYGSEYPDWPEVYCKTLVYHPNIENVDQGGAICLNFLDEEYQCGSMTLEGVVQGILFLMHNPNPEDPYEWFFPPHGTLMDESTFADNVRCSLDGGMVNGYQFKRNRVVRGEGQGRTINIDEDIFKEDGVIVHVTDGGGVGDNGDANVLREEGRAKEGGVAFTDKSGTMKSVVMDKGGLLSQMMEWLWSLLSSGKTILLRVQRAQDYAKMHLRAR
ncbi:NEDD8-conjugating enzyme Ubc12-like [Patiria miniata]|uniref:UBC core domain-containing protein n=1 Tax=Patiria miniata TaxID=46514 RepID=A0A914ABR6_PATMI|nr:NEDD8-conjugating enzyme Ubc12-like [Patiria miniata]